MLLVHGLVFPTVTSFLLGWPARVMARAEQADRDQQQAVSRLDRRNRQIEAL